MSRRGVLEREAKLAARADFEMPELDGVLDGVMAVVLPDQVLEAVYYDTGDLRLARTGITVRYRTGEGRNRRAGKWTVKLPEGERGPALVRREIDVVAPGRVVPADVTSLVRATVRSSLLAPVGALRTARRRIALRDPLGVTLAEVVDDDVSFTGGVAEPSAFREIEVELTDDAPAQLLAAVIKRLRKAGATATTQTPKILRAMGPAATEPPEVRPAALDPDEATLSDVIAAAIADGYTRLVRHDPGVRLGGDAEDVHQARVAARRLRSDLRTFRDLLDDERARSLRDELRWLGGVLGGARDVDVLLEWMSAQAASLPDVDGPAAAALLRRLESEREERAAEILAALDSDRYLRLLDDLAAAAQRPPVRTKAGALARKRLPAYVRGPGKHLRRAVETLGDPPEEEALHDIRIRAKRARYAAEAAAPVLGKPALRFAKAAAKLQSELGDLQDAVVADAWLRSAARKAPTAQALVAGQLIARQKSVKAEVRAEWPAAWADVAEKRFRRWLG